MIEINRAKSIYIFRINPYNDREIDRRLNRHGARWERYSQHGTPAEARATLFAIEARKKQKDAAK